MSKAKTFINVANKGDYKPDLEPLPEERSVKTSLNSSGDIRMEIISGDQHLYLGKIDSSGDFWLFPDACEYNGLDGDHLGYVKINTEGYDGDPINIADTLAARERGEDVFTNHSLNRSALDAAEQRGMEAGREVGIREAIEHLETLGSTQWNQEMRMHFDLTEPTAEPAKPEPPEWKKCRHIESGRRGYCYDESPGYYHVRYANGGYGGCRKEDIEILGEVSDGT